MTRPAHLAIVSLAAAVWLGTDARAQGAAGNASAAAPSAAPAAVHAAPGTPPSDTTFTYESGGRRDPFVSLLSHGSEGKGLQGGRRPDGLGGLSVAEVSVRGVMQSHGGYVAILQGPDNKTYIARPNDRLFDGTIRSISGQGLTVVQEVNDPLSLVKQKEVHKGLRASDEGK